MDKMNLTCRISALILVFAFILGGCTLPNWMMPAGTPAPVILPTATMNPADLEGISWQLQTADEKEFAEASRFTIRFSNGSMEGDAGCEGYRGAYQSDEDHITFPTFNVLGDTTCDDQILLAQEKIFFSYLERVNRYRVTADRLELYTNDGETLVFMPEQTNQ